MISILIPIYNTDPTSLVKKLLRQASKIKGLAYEVILSDDKSTDVGMRRVVADLDKLEGVRVHFNASNIGRAANRNKLGELAAYDNLLYLDGDAEIIQDDFMVKYLDGAEKGYDVIYGGRAYPAEPPAHKYMLRWSYARKYEALTESRRREDPYRTFGSNNFMIRKDVLKRVPFNERIRTYGYEDNLLATDLRKEGYEIKHIDNPTMHKVSDTNEQFIRKTREAIQTLLNLQASGHAVETRLSRVGNRLRKPLISVLLYIPFLLINSLLGLIILLFPRFVGGYQLYKLTYYVISPIREISDKQSVKFL